MEKLNPESQQRFCKFIAGELSQSEFEEWLYADKTLEEELGSDLYLELISQNFTKKVVIHEVEKLLTESIDYGVLATVRIQRALEDVQERRENYVSSFHHLIGYCSDGCSFLGDLAYEFDIEDIWDIKIFNQLVQQNLEWIRNKKVVIKAKADRRHYEFDDYREEHEKKLEYHSVSSEPFSNKIHYFIDKLIAKFLG